MISLPCGVEKNRQEFYRKPNIVMRMKPYLWAGAMLIGLAGFAQRPQIEFEEYDLKNGMHVILHEDHSTPIVAVTLSYHVGSKNENPERTGFAHFFEHLLFEGTEHIERGEYMKLVQENGGAINANTSFDRTFYYEIMPSNQLELALWMESERLLHAKIDSVGVETQRKVVQEEKRQRYENTPYGKILPETFSRAFQKHPYRWVPIGEFAHLQAASIEEFMEFYKTFYVPNNATLSIAGDINIEQTKKWIDKYFSGIPASKNPIPRPDIVEPAQTEEIRDTVYDNVQLPAVIMAYHSPAQGTDDYYAMQMLSTILSQGNSSRMVKQIVDKKQLAAFAGAFPLPTEDPGLTLMFGIANVGIQPQEVEAAMNEEVDRMKNELISEEEYEKLKNQIESNFIQSNSTVAGIAESLSDYHMYYGDANLINTELDRYMAVSREDIQNVAKKYLNDTNRVVLYWMPNPQNP